MEENLTPGIDGTGTETVATTETVEEPKFTKSQVNEMMTKRVQRSHNAFFNRYGVKDIDGLDELFGQASGYGPLKEEFDNLTNQHNELKTQNEELNNRFRDLNKKYAYKVGNINPDKIADIETYFKGKGIDIDENTLAEELKTHSDWISKLATVVSIGAETDKPATEDERELASQLFGVNLRR